MKPYSNDIRSKVLQAYQRGDGSQREIAARFDVSLTFVRDLLKLFRETGSVEPRVACLQVRGSKIDQESIEFLLRVLLDQPSLSLSQLRERLACERNLRVSRATLCRVLARKRPTNSNLATGASVVHRPYRTAATVV
jgi:transposase